MLAIIRIRITEIGVWEFGQSTSRLRRMTTGAHIAVQNYFDRNVNLGFFEYNFWMFVDGWFLDAEISCNMLYDKQ